MDENGKLTYNINEKNKDLDIVNILNNKELIEKLNYMIHLLEDNKNIKSESVTEDVILYSLLGVFIIFVIDSFSRATKYIR